ncbi:MULTISPECIES: gliding motility protein [unclassified Streptomyces]|uniref:gliding motility protein n=1 Tax=unclassified Streptomyces TaxID=2593676 RepID=UPI002E0DB626
MTEEVAATDPTAESGAADEAGPAAAEAQAAEAVEIPKQQSAEVAADSETGEGART